jgi:sulfur-carrier protein
MDVLLFGMIAEKAGTISIAVEARSLIELRRELAKRIPGIEQLSFAIAVDRKVVHADRSLIGTEEIAVLPPFAGG